jgi:hypothetical protein
MWPLRHVKSKHSVLVFFVTFVAHLIAPYKLNRQVAKYAKEDGNQQ